MKKLTENNGPYILFNQYCLRTPLYPFNLYLEIHNTPRISDRVFEKLFNDKIIQEAVYIASPDLFDELKKWKDGKIEDQKKVERIKLSFLKYLTRISTRCTPFGLFASCGIGDFSRNKSEVRLKPLKNYTKKTGLDMGFSSIILEIFSKHPQLKTELLFYPNNSLYKISDHYRYVEHSWSKNGREYRLHSVNQSEYLKKLLEAAKEGKNIKTLGEELVSEGYSRKDSFEFIYTLINNQILVSGIQPTLTGDGILTELNEKRFRSLKKIPLFPEVKTNFTKLKATESKIGIPVQEYQDIAKWIKGLKITIPSNHLFQIDLYAEFEKNKLNNDLKKSIQEAAGILNRITFPKANPFIEQFIQKYTERFNQREISLTKVMDPESGIGYGRKKNDDHSFLEDICLPDKKLDSEKIIWNAFDDILLPLVTAALKNNQKKIILTCEILNTLQENWNDLPETLSSIVEIYKDRNKHKVYINSAGGSTGANLLARFSLDDEEINSHVKNIVQTEEQADPEKIYAEIIHVPQARNGNILQRPALRKYEIPYIAASGLGKEFQIPVDDLVLSVENKNIILRSKTLKKEIIPRLTNAHNYKADALPLYHFLCDLQTYNLRNSIGFQWNPFFSKYDFLPRIEWRNIIFSKAKWTIKTNSIQKFFQVQKENLPHAVAEWKKSKDLPRYAQLTEGDNKLLIDFNNSHSIQMLLKSVKNKKKFILEEFLFDDDDGVVKREQKRFCNQFVVSFYRNRLTHQ